MSLRILFVGDLLNQNNTLFRYNTLLRLGYKLQPINIFENISSNKFLYWINFRYQPYLLNKKLIDKINFYISDKFDLVWIEKGIFVDLRKVKNKKKIPIIHFNPDNPFGPRKDGCWKLFLKNLHNYSYHLTPRISDSRIYRHKYKTNKITFPFCYDNDVHYFEDINKDLDVTFIGSNHDNRYDFVKKLEEKLGWKINVFSDNWIGHHNRGVYKNEYRKIINRSKIMINFITNSNLDSYSRRSIEIAACKTFFISQKGSVQEKIFRNKEETYYFKDINHCSEIIKELLQNNNEIKRVAENAYNRVKKLKLDNESQMYRILKKLT